MQNEKRFIIAGAGAFGREVASWLLRCGVTAAGFLDDTKTKGEMVGQWPVLGGIRDYARDGTDQVLIAIGKPQDREWVARCLEERGAEFATMGSDCIVASGAEFGIGTICCPFSVISAGAIVGRHAHINLCATVGHDVVLGDFCTLSSHVDLCGGVKVGTRAFFGSGARVLPGITIGDDAVIGAGAVVMSDVPAGTTVYAQAARKL